MDDHRPAEQGALLAERRNGRYAVRRTLEQSRPCGALRVFDTCLCSSFKILGGHHIQSVAAMMMREVTTRAFECD